jgi:RHS repeat-associated protein
VPDCRDADLVVCSLHVPRGREISETLNDGSAIAITYYACPNSPTLTVLSSQLTTCPGGAQYAIQTTHTGQDKTTTMSPTTIVYYDSLDREIDADTEAFDGSLSRITKTYDTQLQLASVTRPYFSDATQETTTYMYDALNRVTLTTYPDTSYDTTSYYETYKEVVSGSVPQGFVGETTIKIYDGDGNLLITKQYPVAGSNSNEIDTNFVYDGFDNLSWIIDNSGNVTQYGYDSLGRKYAIIDPDAGNRLQGYTAYSDPSAGGNGYDSFDYDQYDQLARPVSRCWTTPAESADEFTCANPSNSEVLETWSYDPANGIGEMGGETSTQGTTSSTAYTYNSLGQKLTGTYIVGAGSSAKTFGYSYFYDANNRPSYYTSPSGSAPQTNYAASSYVSGMSHHGGTAMWTVTSRDAELHLTGATFGSAAPVTATYSYSPVTGHETGITMAPSGSQTNLVTVTYGWDSLDNLTSRMDTVNSLQEAYCYDGLNRLVSIQSPATTCQNDNTVELSLAYDLLGDLTTKSDVGTYTYPAAGSPQPHGVQTITPTGGGTTIRFSYDSVGKMTSDGLTKNAFTYLPYQMPLTVAHTGGDTETIQYDADHHRVLRKIAGGLNTYYLPDGIATSPATTGLNYTTYYMGDGERVAQDTGAGGATHRYFLNDFQNSVGVVTNDSAAEVQNLAFDAFGQPRNPNGTPDPTFGASAVTPRGYINQEMLRDLNLIDLNARYYDPKLARFLAADPLITDKDNGQSWNAYSYSRNNPMSNSDPTGKADPECDAFCQTATALYTGSPMGGWQGTKQLYASRGSLNIPINAPEARLFYLGGATLSPDAFNVVVDYVAAQMAMAIARSSKNYQIASNGTTPTHNNGISKVSDGNLHAVEPTADDMANQYINGKGKPVYRNGSDVSLQDYPASQFDEKVGSIITVTPTTTTLAKAFAEYEAGTLRTGPLTDAFIYGSLNHVRVLANGKVQLSPDMFNFDMENGRPLRNIETWVQHMTVGQGKSGTDFQTIFVGPTEAPK